jgi:hypothetical protein
MPVGCTHHPIRVFPSAGEGDRSTMKDGSDPLIAGIPLTEADTDQGKGCAPPREGVTGPRDGAIHHMTWVRATR